MAWRESRDNILTQCHFDSRLDISITNDKALCGGMKQRQVGVVGQNRGWSYGVELQGKRSLCHGFVIAQE